MHDKPAPARQANYFTAKQPIAGFDDLTAHLFMKTHPGQAVTFTILRDGKQQDVKVTLGARPQTNQQIR